MNAKQVEKSEPCHGGGDPYRFDVEGTFEPEAYRSFYAFSDERSDREVDFMMKACELRQGASVLDLCCGHGRHANRLAARGFHVSGRDLTAGFIEQAKSEASQRGVRVEYEHADARQLDDVQCYDAVINVFTAFGYWDEDTDVDVLRRICRALKPGGCLLLDTINRDRVLRDFKNTSVQERNDGFMIDRHRFDATTGRLVTERSYLLPERRLDAVHSVRLYTLQELSSSCRVAGLSVDRFWGDWAGNPLELGSPRLMLRARK